MIEPATNQRKRDAKMTRAAILRSARKAFAAAGYDRAGVREIAADAGVTAMMVRHYFGSKEQLFEAAVADAMDTPQIMRRDVLGADDLAHELAKALVTNTAGGHPPLDGFLIIVRSIANPRAAEICRLQIERYHQRQLGEALAGDDARQRAAMALSIVAGFQIMRQLIQLSPLVDAPEDVLTDKLRSLFVLLFSR